MKWDLAPRAGLYTASRQKTIFKWAFIWYFFGFFWLFLRICLLNARAHHHHYYKLGVLRKKAL
jgi:hypothetical protein